MKYECVFCESRALKDRAAVIEHLVNYHHIIFNMAPLIAMCIKFEIEVEASESP